MRRRRTIACGALLLTALSVTAGGRPAQAQVPGEEIARRAFEDGVALEKAADYASALVKFKESSQIKATLGNRFHIAYCLEMTGKLASALIDYEIVEKSAREQGKADLLGATHLRLESLRARVPQLSLHIPAAPKGIQVSLDGSPIAPALLDGQAFRVDPGEHTITANAPEHDPFTKRLTAPEGSSITVDIVLPRKAAVSPMPSASTNEIATETSRSHTLPILMTAGSAVLAVGGIVAFILAGSEQNDARRTCITKTSCDDEVTAVRTFDALALGGFIGAAGLAVSSVVLWTSKPRASSAATSTLTARPSWIGLEGRF